MGDRNRYRRREYGDDFERSYRRDRQPEQFQADRPYYADDYDAGYGQMGGDYASGQSQYAGNYDDSSSRQRGNVDDRYGSSWRQDEGSRNRGRGYDADPSGGYGRASVGNRERGGFGSFNSESYRTAGNLGPPEHLGYGRGESYRQGAYSRGSYGAGSYGAAPRREYGRGSDRDERGFFERAGDEVASWFGDEDAARRREMDHRGRGPANYTRSDERILEDACDRLTEDWGVDASNVQVTVQNGEVTLDGTVENRGQKRRAEDCVHDISGVGHVQNNLRTEANRSPQSDTERSNATERNPGTLA